MVKVVSFHLPCSSFVFFTLPIRYCLLCCATLLPFPVVLFSITNPSSQINASHTSSHPSPLNPSQRPQQTITTTTTQHPSSLPSLPLHSLRLPSKRPSVALSQLLSASRKASCASPASTQGAPGSASSSPADSLTANRSRFERRQGTLGCHGSGPATIDADQRGGWAPQLLWAPVIPP